MQSSANSAGARLHHLGHPVQHLAAVVGGRRRPTSAARARAALTASRTSLRDAARDVLALGAYVRPDSERGNAPPMNSLYVFDGEAA